MFLHQSDGVDELAQTFQGVILGLNRNQHFVHGAHGVDHQQTQARRAVDDHVIVMLFAGGEELVHRVLQQRVAVRHVGDLKFGATQIDGCGDHVEVVEIRARALDFHDALTSFDDVIHRRLTGGVRGTQCRGGVALRIHINKQDLASETGQGRGQVHRGCGFADATFLVGDCDQARLGRLRADRMLQCLVSRRFISDLRAYGGCRAFEDSLDGFRGGFHRRQIVWFFRSSHELAFLYIFNNQVSSFGWTDFHLFTAMCTIVNNGG